MSLKKHLEGKAGGLTVPETSPDDPVEPVVRPPRTAPGQMLAFRDQLSTKDQEIESLQGRLTVYEGSLPTRRLEAKRVRRSSLANRLPESFESTEFKVLKADIASSKGNVQPIKVRPVKGDSSADYEIVYGHRRHQACLELDLSVLAVIEEVTDAGLFSEMDQENRDRKDLAPYELGMHYRRALDRKLWPSQNQMATALGINQSLVSKALVLADLPREVVEAFPSPLALQFRWGSVLADVLRRRKGEVMKRAKQLAAEKGKYSAQRVFEELCALTEKPGRDVLVAGKRMASIRSEGKQVVVRFVSNAIQEERLEALAKAIEVFLEGSKNQAS